MSATKEERPFLQVQNLSIAFPPYAAPVVNNLTFSIEQGASLAIVGESGSGKSLTARAINQCLPHLAHISDQSHIFLEGQDLLELSEGAMQRQRGRRIGYINQEAQSAFNPVQTIGKQIDETLRLHTKLSHKDRKERIQDLSVQRLQGYCQYYHTLPLCGYQRTRRVAYTPQLFSGFQWRFGHRYSSVAHQ